MQGPASQSSPATPQSATYDPSTNKVFVGDGYGSHFYVFNGSTGKEIEAVPTVVPPNGGTYASPFSFAPDPSSQKLFVGNLLGNISVFNLTTYKYEGTIPATSGFLLSYDAVQNFLYAEVWYSSSAILKVINPSNDSVIHVIDNPGGVSSNLRDFCYESGSNTITEVDGSGSAFVLNATTFATIATIRNVQDDVSVYCDPYNRQVYIGDAGYVNGTGAGFGVVTIVNATNNHVITQIQIGSGINDISANPTNGDVYLGNVGFGVKVLDGATNVVVANLNLGSGWYETGLSYASYSNLLFVLNQFGNDLVIFHGLNNTLWRTSALKVLLGGSAYDPDNGDLYVATENGSVSVFDPSTHPHEISSVQAAPGPAWVTVDTRDHRIFVSDQSSSGLSVIDDRNDSVIRSSLMVGPHPLGMAYDPFNDFLYVAVGDANNVTVLNASSLGIVKNIHLAPTNSSSSVGPTDVAFDPNNRMVFVANYYANNLSVIDTSTNALLPKAPGVGTGPDVVQYDPSNGLLYVGNWYSSNITVINVTTWSSVQSIPAGGPLAFTVDPGAGLLYSANGDGTVSIVNTTSNNKTVSDIPIGIEPAGISYVPASDQVDVSDLATGVLSVLADVPRLQSLNFTPSTAESGVQLEVVATVNSGVAPYTYSWGGLPSNCPAAPSAVVDCTPDQPGIYRVTLTVTDSRNYSAWGSAVLDVSPGISIESASLSHSITDVGFPDWVNLTVTGGVGGISYGYSGLPTGCMSRSTSALSCTPSAVGTFALVGTATDRLGAMATKVVVISVMPLPSVSIWAANPSKLALGETVSFLSGVAGGVAPFSYNEMGLPLGCSPENRTAFSCVPSESGNFSLFLNVTDSEGFSALARTGLEVLPATVAPPPQILYYAANPGRVTQGNVTTFVVVATSGSAPLAYSYEGLPPGCSTASTSALRCVPTATGNYSVEVIVTDGLGRNTSSRTSVLVERTMGPNKSSNGTTLTWESSLGIAVVGAVVGAAIAGSFMVVQERRRNRKQPNADNEDTRSA